MDTEKTKKQLQEMYDITNGIIEFSKESTITDFQTDKKLFLATQMLFVQLAEAAKRVPQEAQKELSDIPWRGIADIRNYMAHEYMKVDPGTVLTTCHQHIPELNVQVKQYINELEEPLASIKTKDMSMTMSFEIS